MSASLSIAKLDANQSDFEQRLSALLAWDSVSDASVVAVVDEIITAIKARGDTALLEYTNRFDRMQVENFNELELSSQQIQQALKNISSEQRVALETAANRIEK